MSPYPPLVVLRYGISFLCFSAALILLASSSSAQSCATVQVPVVLTTPDSTLVRDVRAEGFVVKINDKPVQVEAASYDSAPRRILVVLDTSHHMKKQNWTILSGVAEEILQRADARDSFALLTARGPRVEVKFGGPRAALLQKLKALAEARGRKESSQSGTLDAALEGAEWFGPAQPGDSILLLAEDVEKNNKADYDSVARQLLQRQIRLFTFLAGRFVAGHFVTSSVSQFYSPVPSARLYDPVSGIDYTNIAGTSYSTGGYFMLEDTAHPLREYKLTPERLKELKHRGWQMYGAIVYTYFIRLRLPSERKKHELQVALTDSVKQNTPKILPFYPRELYCQAE